MQPWKSIIQAYCLLPILPNQVPSVNHVPVLFVTFGRLPAPEDETGTLLGKVGGEGEEKGKEKRRFYTCLDWQTCSKALFETVL